MGSSGKARGRRFLSFFMSALLVVQTMPWGVVPALAADIEHEPVAVEQPVALSAVTGDPAALSAVTGDPAALPDGDVPDPAALPSSPEGAAAPEDVADAAAPPAQVEVPVALETANVAPAATDVAEAAVSENINIDPQDEVNANSTDLNNEVKLDGTEPEASAGLSPTDESAETGGGAAPAAPTAVAVPVEAGAAADPVITPSVDGATSASYTIAFVDNGNSAHLRPSAQAVADRASLQFSLDGSAYYPLLSSDGSLSEQARDLLGLTEVPPYALVGSEPTLDRYVIEAAGLPAQVVYHSSVEGAEVPPAQPIHWAVVPDDAVLNEGLDPSQNRYEMAPGMQEGVDQVATLCSSVKFAVDIRGGEGSDDGALFGELMGSMELTVHDGPDAVRTCTLEEALSQGLLTWSYDPASGLVEIEGMLPRYSASTGNELGYSISYTGPQEGEDYWQAVYDNGAVPNHGSDATQAWAGGTLKLIHAGTTSFTASKLWEDGDDPAGRPEVKFTLLRYSCTPRADASQAAPVPVDGSHFAEVVVGAASGENPYTIVFPSDGSYTLPKFDPDGNPYVYCVLEDMGAGTGTDYSTVLGAIDPQTGAVTDTPPSCGVQGEGWVRPADDPYVYDGGTVSNVRTGTTSLGWGKQFLAQHYQDQLQNVTCVFKVQQRVAGSDGAWADVAGPDGGIYEVRLSNFASSSLLQGTDLSLPAYDFVGRELEYRFVETDVLQNGVSTGYRVEETPDGTYKGYFNLELTDPNTHEVATVLFESTLAASSDEVVSNAPAASTYQNIVKQWRDESGADVPGPEDGIEVGFELWRDGQLLATLYADGDAQDPVRVDPANALSDLGATAVENEPWHVAVEGLPQFSADGKAYSYQVRETALEGWVSSRSFDPATHTTTVVNAPNTGAGVQTSFDLEKFWIDGGNTHAAESVGVELRATQPIEATDAAGNPVRYEAGDVLGAWSLEAGRHWSATVALPLAGVTTDKLALVEVSATAADGVVSTVMSQEEFASWATGHGIVYNPYTFSNPAASVLVHGGYVYEVSSSYDQERGAFAVTNRRVGSVSLDVEKAWADRRADPGDEQVPRPQALISLRCVEYPASIGTDADGNGYVVRYDGVRVPILAADGTPMPATVAVDTPVGAYESSYSFNNLPKYDAAGTRIHYRVVETWAEGTDVGDYVSSRKVGPYEQGPYNYRDSQSYAFTNSRTGVTTAVFYKQWNDQYVADVLKQRPDIYLTLYASDSEHVDEQGNAVPYPVAGYVRVQWSMGGSYGAVTFSGSATFQTATVANLPKYDANGLPITYWASEAMAADATSLDYVPVSFEGGAETFVLPDGTTLMASGGTFVNGIARPLAVRGEKLWQSVPSDFALDDLPDVAVVLERRLQGSDDEWVQVACTSDFSKEGRRWGYELRFETDADGTPVEVDGQPVPLPTYDPAGRLYEYRTVERIDGLSGTPGTADDVFKVSVGAGGNYRIVNSYAPTSGNLTVKKLYGNHPAGELYPDLTFTLYRQYTKADGSLSSPYRVEQRRLASRDVVDDQGSVTFAGLPVYAPNGQPWLYSVVEKGIGGYASTVALGNLSSTDDPAFGAHGPVFGGELSSADSVGPIGIPGGEAALDEVADLTFANVYEPAPSFRIEGTKHWVDWENAFGIRPDDLTLELTRSYAGGTQAVELQSDDSQGAAYLTWDKGSRADAWTFSIENLEVWAPDDTLWRYTVTEVLNDGDGYRVQLNFSPSFGVTAVPGDGGSASGALRNTLDGRVSVSKTWEGDNTELDLRPAQVGIELQASVDRGATWGPMREVLAAAGFDMSGVLQGVPLSLTLPFNGRWSTAWGSLPLMGVVPATGERLSISYRVVETFIGTPGTPMYQPIVLGQLDAAGTDYGTTYPYQVSATVSGSLGGLSGSLDFSIKNSLYATDVSITKVWDDADDYWGLRRDVTFALERRAEGGQWEPVMRESDPAAPVTATLAAPAAPQDSATLSLTRLPAYLPDGTPCEYRLVEVAQSPYDGVWSDGQGNAVPSEDAGMDGQTLTNRLRTVGLVGTKAWDDADGAAPVPDVSDEAMRPTLVLERSSDGGTTWSAVTCPDGPVWSAGEGGSWTFAYEGLPACDASGNAYSYRARELGVVPGYHPVQADAPSTLRPDGTAWENPVMTNELNRLALEKLGADGAPLNGVSLAVRSLDRRVTYALWERDGDGGAAARVWRSGTLDPEGDGTCVSTAGVLVGLAAGIYRVEETVPPNGYTVLEPAVIEIAASGAATLLDAAPGWSVSADGAALTAVDKPVSAVLYKLSAQDWQLLPSAVFRLEGRFSDGTSVRELTTGADGSVALEDLVAGETYRLSETGAPSGHAQLAGSVEVRVDWDGTLSVVDGDAWAGAVGVVGGGTGIAVVDDITQVALRKADAADPSRNLTGAQFVLENLDTGTQSTVSVDEGHFGYAVLSGLDTGVPYRIYEAAAPAGYRLDPTPFDFHLDAAGRLVADGPVGAPYAVEDGGLVLTACDTELAVRIEKADLEGRPLLGAVYALSGVFLDSGGEVETRTLSFGDESSLSVGKLLAGETYTLEEVVPPSGYRLVRGTCSFSVGSDGTVSLVGAPEGFSAASDGLGIVAVDRPVVASLLKVSAAGQAPLAGAEFTLEGVFADGSGGASGLVFETRSLRTDASGVVALEGLVVGRTYVLAEATAPSGHALLKGEAALEVQPDGTLVLLPESFGPLAEALAVDGSGVRVVVADEPTLFRLSKVDAGDASKALAGAKFELANGKTGETSQLAVGDDGTLELRGVLDVGVPYSLRETEAPVGYRLDPTVFSFWLDGSGNLVARDAGPYRVVAGEVAVVMADEPATAVLTKVSATDGRPLEGAEFTLEGSFADGSREQRLVTDADGNAQIGLLVGGERYTLTETAPPAGHRWLSGSAVLAVAPDGTLDVVASGEGASELEQALTVEGGALGIRVADEPTRLTLGKTDASDTPHPLTGARFVLINAHTGSVSLHEVDDPAGLVLTGVLDVETPYILQEVVAPDGYRLDPTPFAFSLAPDGTLVAQDAGGYRVGADGVSIVASDVRVAPMLYKVSAHGWERLEGAEFRLEGPFTDGSDSREFITGADGSVVLDGLCAGQSYILSELRAPSGHTALAGSIELAVASDGMLSIVGDAWGGAASVTPDGLGIAVVDDLTMLALRKVDASDPSRSLIGAEFELTNLSTGLVRTIAVTDESFGYVFFGELDTGTRYSIRETKAPEGYALDPTPFAFSVAPDGTLVAQDAGGYRVEAGGLVLTACDVPLGVDLEKVGSDGEPLTGAVYALSGVFSDSAGAVQTRTLAFGDGSSLSVGHLLAGETYTLVEQVAPAGHVCVGAELSFSIDEAGRAVLAEGADASLLTLTGDGRGLMVHDRPTELTLEKVDASDPTKTLAGAVFELVDVATGEKTDLAVDVDGRLTLRGVLSVGVSYTLREVEAPEGYELDGTVFAFSLASDGTLVAQDAGGYRVGADGVSIVLADRAAEPVAPEPIPPEPIPPEPVPAEPPLPVPEPPASQVVKTADLTAAWVAAPLAVAGVLLVVIAVWLKRRSE